jgi:hypothetical protein
MDAQHEFAHLIASCMQDARASGNMDWGDIKVLLDQRIAELPEEKRLSLLNLLNLMAAAPDADCNPERLH